MTNEADDMKAMDTVLISSSSSVLDGLRDMLESAIGPHDYVHAFVEVPIALLVIEIAKRAEDREEWFPRGKWATIQSMQNAAEEQLTKLFAEKAQS